MNQSDNGKRQVLRMIVRDQLFPRMKFVNKHELQFSMDTGSVCHFVMTKLTDSYGKHSLQEKMEFWNEYKNVVMTKLTQQRNNCIQSINHVTKGKHCVSFAFDISQLHSHLILQALLTARTENRTLLTYISDARERRKDLQAYTKLLMAYGGALVGINDWKKQHLTASFSKYVTIADEAFLWLCLDTYLPLYNPTNIDSINPTDGHILMVSNKDSGLDNSATPLTPTSNDSIKTKTRNTSPTANGNRYGWTKEGILRYNRYFTAIEQERKVHTNFDAYFLKECQANATPAQTTTAQKIQETPTFALNCL